MTYGFLENVLLFVEYEAVLRRPAQRQVHGLSDANLDILLAVWARYVEPVTLRYLWRPQLRDPADEMVLETAVNGGAEALGDFQKTFSPRKRHPSFPRTRESIPGGQHLGAVLAENDMDPRFRGDDRDRPGRIFPGIRLSAAEHPRFSSGY